MTDWRLRPERKGPNGTEGRRRKARRFGNWRIGRADHLPWLEDGWRAVAGVSARAERTWRIASARGRVARRRGRWGAAARSMATNDKVRRQAWSNRRSRGVAADGCTDGV